jgi:hypothetical protein
VGASSELAIYDFGPCVFESAIGRARKNYRHNLVGIAMIDTPRDASGIGQAIDVGTTTNRNSCSEKVRIAPTEFVGSHCAHRDAHNVDSFRVNIRELRDRIDHSLKSLKLPTRFADSSKHSLRKLGETIWDRPKSTLRSLREKDVGRITVADIRVEELTRAVKKLSFVVGATLASPMKEKHNRILFVGLYILRLEIAIRQSVAIMRKGTVEIIFLRNELDCEENYGKS